MYTEQKIQWVDTSINILGVEVTTEASDLCRINYGNMFDKIVVILQNWHKRGLSLIGKIMIINMLIASLFVYKMTVLPLMPKKYITKLNQIV